MKMRDDTTSVKHILDKSKFSVEDGFGVDAGDYTIDQFKTAIINSGNMINNPSSNWKGQKPLDNLLVGFNIGTNFDEKKRFRILHLNQWLSRGFQNGSKLIQNRSFLGGLWEMRSS